MDALKLNQLLEKIRAFEYGGISAERAGIALSVLLSLIIIFKIFRSVVLTKAEKLAKKTKTDFDDLLVDMLEEIPQHFYWMIAAYISFQSLGIENETVKKVVTSVFIVFVVYRVIHFLQKFVAYTLTKTLAKNEENETAINGIRIIASIILWAIGLLLILQNLGFEITTLVASLGIGGIAIAFAFQQILADLFSSFAIYFDKPFKIGDYVVLGADSGTIKKIGLKTTRIQTLQGEELVVSNAELTSTRIKNFKRMKKRRVAFNIGVTYGTTSVKLKKIPKLIKKAISKQKLAEFNRCHFKSFGDFSLNFEIIYYVKNREYLDYMNTHHEINLEIKSEFEKAKIKIAFPTQTVYLEK